MKEKAKGLIFNKVQGSFVDGYGVRTTIFLKGCPLKCKWCCNPEGQSFEPELKVSYDKCNGCGRCIEKCKQKALSMNGELVSIDRNLCNICGECADFCYTGALEPFGRYYTVDEMFDLVKKDIPFFNSTGGGLTIGGGEATWHPDFVLPLMEKCHDEGINVAIDTCGYVSDQRGLEILKAADLLLFDIKGIDSEEHKLNTGVDNELIWSNLKILSDLGKPIIIRIPIIPGYTDSEENLKLTAERLQEIHTVERIDILPAHNFGRIKYDQIGLEYVIDPTLSISEERQQKIKDFFESYGFLVQIGG